MSATMRVFGKSPVGAYLRLNEWIWQRLPGSSAAPRPRPVVAYGHLMHALVRSHGERRQFLGTFFLRNRPQLELIAGLAKLRAKGAAVRMAVLGCSIGAEAYSILWSIRSSHPDLSVVMTAVDISDEVIAVAREGIYSSKASDLVEEPICERMTDDELRGMFDREGPLLRVKPWMRESVSWRLADARDPEIVAALGGQDIVVANDFLCHMKPAEAESCLRNIARLVEPGGYLVVSGIDLDVRSKVARALSWKPVTETIEEIHDGDRSLRLSWPWRYWGLEPFDKTRHDSDVRYASAFQVGETN
jgi:chemotaxis protein methyltransferase CheR